MAVCNTYDICDYIAYCDHGEEIFTEGSQGDEMYVVDVFFCQMNNQVDIQLTEVLQYRHALIHPPTHPLNHLPTHLLTPRPERIVLVFDNKYQHIFQVLYGEVVDEYTSQDLETLQNEECE